MRWWGEHATTSPLYSRLVEVVAESDDLLRVINRIENAPQANLLFGAVQYLLMTGPATGLADFYANLIDNPRPAAEVDGPFTDFVLAHESQIVEIGSTRPMSAVDASLSCRPSWPGLSTASTSSTWEPAPG